MQDYIVTAISKDHNFKIYASTNTNVVKELQERHNTSATASVVIGKNMIVTSMIGVGLENKQHVSTVINGRGELGKIYSNADHTGSVNGIARFNDASVYNDVMSSISKKAIRRAIGTSGYIDIKIYTNMELSDSYEVPILLSDIQSEYSNYFLKHKNIPSAISVGVLVNPTNEQVIAAGGYLIQLLPGASNEAVEIIEERLNAIDSALEMIYSGKTPEDIIEIILGKGNFQITEKNYTQFKCNCTREKFLEGLIALPAEEIKNMYNEKNDIETRCRLCGKKYTFSKSEFMNAILR